MPADKIKCCLCGLRKHYDEFSKTSRKEKEPACKRCVAWTETQEPGVIPAPLETGHVSIEEFGPSYWGGEYRTGEDFFVGDRSHETIVPPRGIRSSYEASSDTVSETVSTQTSAGTPTLPSHLRHRVEDIERSSDDASSVMPSASDTTTQSSTDLLPPHLRLQASSVSTATTFRNNRPEKSRPGVQYNAFGPSGEKQVRTKVRTVPSSTTSGCDESKRSSRGPWPRKPPREPRPHRQIDANDALPVVRATHETNQHRTLGFCDSDNDSDY